ncbi:hypothetical protein ACFR9U_00745 [Halorientalis brevis]|uniref:Uncharacterized protein n=1 Tax=Halorientalis brevis TaxID=1126241 RepID=A0ABD6C5C7_9EURY|nr:hypothetical protein [Halorientalis brevis]
MSLYTVRREIESVGTANAASTGVAKSTAADDVREQLTEAGADAIAALDVEATDVYEFPSGPFDPYRVHIEVTLSVTVEASDDATATEVGEDRIAEILAASGLDDVEYAGPAEADAAA